MPLRWPFLLLVLTSASFAQTVLVAPYLQPGNGATLTGSDTKVIAWVTDQTPGDFVVEYAVGNESFRQVRPERVKLDFGIPKPKPVGATSAATSTISAATPAPVTATPIPSTNPLRDAATDADSLAQQIARSSSVAIPEKEQHYFTYHSTLTGLPFDGSVRYRVKLGANVVREGIFHTRASAEKTIRFVAVGDLANGKADQNAIAWQIYQQKPDFMVALGDIVYSDGRVSQYMHHFWPTYNDVTNAGPTTGAPLFGSIPLYPVLGNHDADRAKLPDIPDAFGAFYFFHVPSDGPGIGSWNLPLGRDKAVADAFRVNAGATYPSLNEYSWDYGPAHFVALDSNFYNKVDDPKFLGWLENDLRNTRQPWKFVCYHAPAFQTSREHYTEQKMRLLEPIFEKYGVDVVFAGHVHNYQRSKPLRFTPVGGRDARGRVNGEIHLDEQFDGVTRTKPDGVIHIVSGGGGAGLYSVDLTKTIEALKKEHGANYVPLTEKYNARLHSFSFVVLSPTTLSFRQISKAGEDIDQFTITKTEPR